VRDLAAIGLYIEIFYRYNETIFPADSAHAPVLRKWSEAELTPARRHGVVRSRSWRKIPELFLNDISPDRIEDMSGMPQMFNQLLGLD
jgi:hypothetical protein